MIGALVFAPGRVQSAEEAIDDLCRELATMLEQIASDLTAEPGTAAAEGKLARARAIAGETRHADRALADAEKMLRLNPRARAVPRTSIALRDGLETKEHVAVGIRGISRSIAADARLDGGPIRNTEVRKRLAIALRELAGAERDFGRLVRADIITGGAVTAVREMVEADLLHRPGEVRRQEEALSELMRAAPCLNQCAGASAWPGCKALAPSAALFSVAFSTAILASSTREEIPSLRNTWRRWKATVCTLTYLWSATS